MFKVFCDICGEPIDGYGRDSNIANVRLEYKGQTFSGEYHLECLNNVLGGHFEKLFVGGSNED